MFDDETIENDIKKCSRCALCLQKCPIFDIKKDENNSCRGLICKLSGYFEEELDEDDIKQDMKICLNCSKCKHNCPSKVDTTRIFAYKNAQFSPTIISQRILLFVKLLPIKSLYFLNFFKKKPYTKHTQIVYFKGCVAKSQHKNTFLDEYDASNVCCGLPYLTSGDLKNYMKAQIHNVKIIQKAKKVIFDCASCKNAVEEYSQLDNEDKKKLVFFDFNNLKNNTKYKKITFHKPCHLSKEDFEKIEKTLKEMKDVEYIPLEDNELCCGFGGSYFIFHPIIAFKIAMKCAQNINKTEADLILTACPSCTLGVRFGQIISKGFKKTMELRDFVEYNLKTSKD